MMKALSINIVLEHRDFYENPKPENQDILAKNMIKATS